MSESSRPVIILRQLIILRNITIFFVLLIITLSVFALNIVLPIVPLMVILFFIGIANLVTHFVILSGKEIKKWFLFTQILSEIVFYSFIFYYSGGATNPFTFFYLVPLAISATVLSGELTLILTSIATIFYSMLLTNYYPIYYGMEGPGFDMGSNGQFSQHVLGMLLGFIISAVLVTWFITHLSRELKQRDQAIAEAKQRELRDQQMVSLGTLATGTAHELGTPLASLAIVTGELTEGFSIKKDPELFAQQQILREQINRCKNILSVLSDHAGQSRADSGGLVSINEFIEDVIDHWQQGREGTLLNKEIEHYSGNGHFVSDRILKQAIINLLNNASDASPDEITMNVKVKEDILLISIKDNGPGMTDEQILQAGDVAFSTKPDGMGIGLFLALTTLRRIGASVNFERHKEGTQVMISLPIIKT